MKQGENLPCFQLMLCFFRHLGQEMLEEQQINAEHQQCHRAVDMKPIIKKKKKSIAEPEALNSFRDVMT